MAQLSFLTYLRGIYKLNLNQSSKVHNAIIQSIYDCFIMVQDDIDLMRLEMCLSTASGYWLDYWGEFFAVFRKLGESDELYSKRIIDSVIQPKSTIPAIKDNVVNFLNSKYNKNYTREDISVREPYMELAKYSHKGTLSDSTRFFSPDYYCHAVMDISVPEKITQDLIDLINSIKSAGVKILWSILNQYNIVSGFNDANDAWVAYDRHIQTQTQRNMFGGLVLSNSSPNPFLSGTRETWYWVTSTYQWYAYIQDKDTDDSEIITKRDLIGLLDYYLDTETTNDVEELIKITDDMINSLQLLDNFMKVSYSGRLSTSEGVMFKHLAEHDLFQKLLNQIEVFKANNPKYYNSVQPPILNGERVMWLVERNKNWIWNTPTMTIEDFYELWEPFDDYEEFTNSVKLNEDLYSIQIDDETYKIFTSTGTDKTEHTINSIIEFEDAYYNGYITFGDKYQPPVVVGKRQLFTSVITKDWLFGSPVYCNFELEEIYRRQFRYLLGQVDLPNPTLEQLISLEEKYNYEGYSISTDTQPAIEVVSFASG